MRRGFRLGRRREGTILVEDGREGGEAERQTGREAERLTLDGQNKRTSCLTISFEALVFKDGCLDN